ncbi:MAG: hypothetical protein C0601_10810 [Candidatus Muiribacterium halophilum]|uniref:HPP transmembrane region domain-containing protein n=1 Tax=Muiribacterium halophilum TaxID=2053465 RepID=A0A2N5ZBS4_MUIH1|nr:MAG: hypothetical protein C0601_10810 [Candidatus Muirbacterium halophilum]
MRFIEKIIDLKALKHPQKYIFQSLIGMLTMLVVLVFLDVLTHTGIISTLAATSFIVWTRPHSYSADPRRLIGGTSVGMLVGVFSSHFAKIPWVITLFGGPSSSFAFFGSLTVFLTIFIMVITDTEHPPAAGISLSLVLNQWSYGTLAFVMSVILVISFLRSKLRPYMIELR